MRSLARVLSLSLSLSQRSIRDLLVPLLPIPPLFFAQVGHISPAQHVAALKPLSYTHTQIVCGAFVCMHRFAVNQTHGLCCVELNGEIHREIFSLSLFLACSLARCVLASTQNPVYQSSGRCSLQQHLLPFYLISSFWLARSLARFTLQPRRLHYFTLDSQSAALV